MDGAFRLLGLVPLLPLLGAALLLIVGRRLPKRVLSVLPPALVCASFLIVCAAFAALLGHPPDDRAFRTVAFHWFDAGEVTVDVAFLFDPLSAVMALFVSGVSFLIHVYSVGYMGHDPRYSRYFGYLNLFVAAMLTLVLADNLLLMFVGWEGVGLCSYLLIGFWFEKRENAAAGMKAFIVNRIGDAAFLSGALLLFWGIGAATGVYSFRFADFTAQAGRLDPGLLALVGILLFGGACGKSAQIPLYVWLPDAMAGPTPVSALIHAATMVTAGVYMVARMHAVYVGAPAAMAVVASVGAATAVFAATIGILQNDIKKVLAYSTVSQLGYMFLGVGVGAYAAGIFHVMTHAFFKALLFLGAGSVIHALGGEQDLRKMGGLRGKLPWTFSTFFIATLALAGIPPLAGFFSKDEILWQAFASPHGSKVFWALGTLGAGITAFYMFRLVFLAFWGEFRGDAHAREHLHESPAVMLVPLVVLAGGAVAAGGLGIPEVLGGTNLFERFLEPVVGAAPTPIVEGAPIELGLMAGSVGVALGGILLAWVLYRLVPALPDRLMRAAGGLYRLVANKYYVDEIYDRTIVAPLLAFNEGLAAFDAFVVDGAVNLAGRVLVWVSRLDGWIDRVAVDGAVNGVAGTIVGLGRGARRLQTGQIQNYLLLLVGAVVLVMIAQVL